MLCKIFFIFKPIVKHILSIKNFYLRLIWCQFGREMGWFENILYSHDVFSRSNKREQSRLDTRPKWKTVLWQVGDPNFFIIFLMIQPWLFILRRWTIIYYYYFSVCLHSRNAYLTRINCVKFVWRSGDVQEEDGRRSKLRTTYLTKI